MDKTACIQLLTLSTLLFGCATVPPASHRGVLLLVPQVLPGLHTQGEVLPYTQDDIDHLTLRLFSANGPESPLGIEKNILKAQLGNPITLSGLKANTTYRVKAYAYATGDLLISSEDTNSQTDIVLLEDDRPTMAAVKVRLIDRPFNGQATASNIIVTNGGYTVGRMALGFLLQGNVNTLAGNGDNTALTDGAGTGATFFHPRSIAMDTQGTLYVADSDFHAIRKISPNGQVETLAGNQSVGITNGIGTAANFASPRGIAIDPQGNIYVADTFNHAIRKITPAKEVTTLAGNGSEGMTNGQGTNARFRYPQGAVVDPEGNLFVADTFNHCIRKITSTGEVTTFAGSENFGFTDGTGTEAKFVYPQGIATDILGNLYVADQGNNRIRKISQGGVVTTLAGNGNTAPFLDGTGLNTTFNQPTGIALDTLGNIYVADMGNNAIRQVTPEGIVTTVAGNGAYEFADGTGLSARFKAPAGVAVDFQGFIYIADHDNNRIRKIR